MLAFQRLNAAEMGYVRALAVLLITENAFDPWISCSQVESVLVSMHKLAQKELRRVGKFVIPGLCAIKSNKTAARKVLKAKAERFAKDYFSEVITPLPVAFAAMRHRRWARGPITSTS